MLSTRTIHLATDVPYYPAKTPARGTKHRSENAYQGAMTIQNGKRKIDAMRTPFQPKTAQPQRLLKDGLESTKTQIHLVNRTSKPLADKTPFANRILNTYNTPGPENKSLKFTNVNNPLERHGLPPDTGSPRVSSTRKHPRIPKSGDNRFQTPANQGNHWDVSDGEIIIPETEQVAETEEPMDDNDEIEYMAPNTLDLAYQPPFDFEFPDYKELGQAVLHSVYCYPQEHLPPPTFDFQIEDNDFMKWDSLSLPSLASDDESSRPSKHTRNISTSRTASAVASNIRVSSRPTTATSTRRPATSASTRPLPLVSSARPITRPASTMTIRGATSSSITRKPSTSIPRTTAAPKQPLTRPTLTRPATTRPTTTTIRPRAATTTTTRTTSRPPTSASTSRPLTSASIRTTGSTSTVKAAIIKPKPAPAVVKKPVTKNTAVAATARSKVASTPTIARNASASSRKPAAEPVVSKTISSKRCAAASRPQSVDLAVATRQMVEDRKSGPLDKMVEENEVHPPTEEPAEMESAETESFKELGRNVDTIQEENPLSKETDTANEHAEALEA